MPRNASPEVYELTRAHEADLLERAQAGLGEAFKRLTDAERAVVNLYGGFGDAGYRSCDGTVTLRDIPNHGTVYGEIYHSKWHRGSAFRWYTRTWFGGRRYYDSLGEALHYVRHRV